MPSTEGPLILQARFSMGGKPIITIRSNCFRVSTQLATMRAKGSFRSEKAAVSPCISSVYIAYVRTYS